MQLADCFAVWDRLENDWRAALLRAAATRHVSAGTLLHNGDADCVGLLAVRAGRLRVYSLSEAGKQVTLYRLFPRDVCLFSAACMLPDIQFDVIIQAEKDSEVWVIPAAVYRECMDQSAALANYTNQIMASRFSEVMWRMEQIMWKSMDRRLAAFLIEESALERSMELRLTHETIANHLGSAREVVTRMLRYFQSEGWVELRRGAIRILNPEALRWTAT